VKPAGVINCAKPSLTLPRMRQYSVYVISLEKGVWSRNRFRAKNRDLPKSAACYYVGSTVRTPELRFEQHKRGYKACSIVREFGEALVPELYEAYNPIPTRADAEELERYLAGRLRSRGCAVWMN